MCKKLMFLISFVCLLGLSLPVSAADLEVEWPDIYTVSGVEEYGDMDISGKVIVPAGATLIMNDESDLDGNGDDGEGGDGATILVDGGTFIMHDRLNMGCDHDAYLIVDNGGVVQHDGDKVTVPDNDGGEHRIIIIDGSMVAEEIEIIHDRDAKVILGCNATIEVCNTDEDNSRDPDQWLSDGDLLCHVSCGAGVMTVEDLGGNCKVASCLLVPDEAWKPNPKDGATEIGRETCPLIVSWQPGALMVDPSKGRHLVFFGTDEDAVANSPTPFEPGFPGPEYQGYTMSGDLDFDLGTQPLWTELFWRIDESTELSGYFKGNTWKLTTGCTLIPGDANLDCVVNFLDYAALLTTWLDEQFFPEGCTP
jgi:hypothetical protein